MTDTRDLLDDDGENLALRYFLMLYGTRALTVYDMKQHLDSCGFPHWPEWANKYAADSRAHLTKGGAQDWIRHLISLEPASIRAKLCVDACVGLNDYEINLIHEAGFPMAQANMQMRLEAVEQQRDEAVGILEVLRHWYAPPGRASAYRASQHPLWPGNNNGSKLPIFDRIDEIVSKVGGA